MEYLTSLFKFDAPIGRLRFLMNAIVVAVLLTIVAMLFASFKLSSLVMIFAVIIGLLATYLNVVNFSKRFWDIIGDFKKSVIFAVILGVVCPIIPLIGPLVMLIAILYLLFAPGKDA